MGLNKSRPNYKGRQGFWDPSRYFAPLFI